jgi:ectoine hydroxylase-related dioxygenase (phytanoyl-CoA dioxygenase family)
VVALPSSNGVPIEFSDRYFAPARDSTRLLAEPDHLRERYRQDGYLILRDVLDRDEVLRLRAKYFAAFPAEYFKPGTRPGDGVYSGYTPDDLPSYGVSGHPAHEFVRSRTYAAFTAQPRLKRLAGILLDGPAELVRRKVLRHFDLAAKQASRAHVDRAYPSGAGSDLVTFWMPLGDCPLEGGGLIYLSGSHQVDLGPLAQSERLTDRPDDPRPLSHDLAWTARTLGGQWLWTDFRAGDVAVHCPDLVHASLDTATETMRLSTDVRFQRPGAPVNPSWTRDWSADDGA